MNKWFEEKLYSFGLCFSGYSVAYELDLLKRKIPDSFLKRDVIDIGCGSGRVSLRLKGVLKPITFKGYDLSPFLVKSALRRGIDAKVLDAEKDELSGDLGILWGVLHHFKDPAKGLKKISKNFNSLIIRESINDKRIFEIAHRLNRKKLIAIVSKAGIRENQFKIIESKKTKSLIMLINCQ